MQPGMHEPRTLDIYKRIPKSKWKRLNRYKHRRTGFIKNKIE